MYAPKGYNVEERDAYALHIHTLPASTWVSIHAV